MVWNPIPSKPSASIKLGQFPPFYPLQVSSTTEPESAMVSAKQLLSTIESTLLGTTPPSASQRIELIHALRSSFPSLQSLLSFPPPKPSDRAQVQSKEVRLPDSGPIPLDDQDVQIALKLSDDLHLNEIDCVQLLVSANQEWGLLGRGPLDILRLAEGLWYTERRDLITALYTLLRAIVLDQGLEPDLQADILKYVEDLISGGLRQRLITLIKELNREEPAGVGGPNSERYILDSRGALVERRAVVCRERLILGHCLVLSLLVVRASPKDVKDIFSTLKDSAGDIGGSTDIVKNQIAYSLLFSLIISLISDALSASPEKMSILSQDASFKHDFHQTVMAIGNDQMIEGCLDCVRLAWAVHLMIILDVTDNNDVRNISSCLELVFTNNAFQFLLNTVLRTPAYQNDDEDMIYMYNAYLHKLITSFLSHPLARDKVKETKEKAMTALSPYKMSGSSHDYALDGNVPPQQASESAPQTFVSLLEFVSEIYEKEPELLSGNDVLWTFVTFAGEDHTNFQTLVAFLKMLSTLASSEEGASKVYELLQGRTFRSISWTTLFECLSIYEEKFKQALQNSGLILPEFQEGDAKALVAYLSVLRKVVENGNPIERKTWFQDIEPLFKLLSYENVPPYLKGSLRDSILTFIHVSPNLKDTVWGFLEQYDLPVVVAPQITPGTQMMTSQVYDMRFELNEVEARSEHYPSTISFLNLLNALIAEERDATDRGRRFIGIFRFIYDHVFGPFPQRAYADPSEKWQLVVACLQHFQMILSMYEIKDEDIDMVASQSQLVAPQSTPLQMQLPVIELLKDFMSGKTVFRNIMSILLPGVDAIIADRTNQTYGLLLEKAVLLSLEIIILVLEKDISVSDFWAPLYQPFDVILSQDHNQIVALLEYIRYDFHPQIQLRSIKIMSILSSRMVGLVPLLLKSNSCGLLVEDYAACLELRSEGCQIIENTSEDPGVLIMQLLIDNVSRPAPNITHFLLKFDLDLPVERTVLQPKFNYSCLKVILDILEMLPKPDVNALLHEFGFQLLYELCSDPLTCGPTIDLLSTKKYQFFVKHLDNIGVAPLPKRTNTQPLRISSLHQRAWLLKLLALELHVGNVTTSNHREVCQNIVAQLFGETEYDSEHDILHITLEDTANRSIGRSKVLDLLEIMQFRSPDTTMKHSEALSHTKFGPVVDDILGNPSTYEKGGVYYYSERGDRLIDLNAFRDTLWQKCNFENPQLSFFGSEAEVEQVRNTVQQLLRWAWKHNKNLEEQAAQLHMLTGWSQIVEISASRRLSSMENRSEILFQLLDASLNASSSPDCSLKMAGILTQVSITCMAKLRDERFINPSVLNSDTVTCLDVIMTRRMSNGACHSILYKIMMAILKHDTSEPLRRRQYTLLLSYFQYCQHILDPDVPTTVLQSLLVEEQESGDLDLEKIDQDQAELARANLSILRKEAQSILDLAIKDATQGSESGRIMAFFVLDALICIDHDKFFLSQLQSRGFLRSSLMSISSVSYQDSTHSIDPLQRLCALEAQLAFLLRISYKYGKSGAQILFSMGAFEHIESCMVHNMQIKGNHVRRFDTSFGKDSFADVHRKRMVVSPLLRLVFSLTSLVETSDFFEVKNKIVGEVVGFVKGHQLLFDQVLRQDVCDADELAMEQMNLVVGILSKVWPYEESGEYGFVQGLFGLMHTLFSRDSTFLSSAQSKQKKSELSVLRLCFSLSSYLYFLVKKKSLRLEVSNSSTSYSGGSGSGSGGGQQQPTLSLLGFLLSTVTTALENAAEEKSILLNKIQDINELARQEVDEIINMCALEGQVASSDNIQKRRYVAMVEMCRVAGNRDRLITLVLLLAENLLNIFLIHFQTSSLLSDSGEAVKALTYREDDLSTFCSKLVPILERLEVLREEKVGHSLKVFQRLTSSLKELTIQKLA
ncbi:hypothetical protein LXL04_002678 [Taraxacum kok-saghyz]